jgi:hypothetical protein
MSVCLGSDTSCPLRQRTEAFHRVSYDLLAHLGVADVTAFVNWRKTENNAVRNTQRILHLHLRSCRTTLQDVRKCVETENKNTAQNSNTHGRTPDASENGARASLTWRSTTQAADGDAAPSTSSPGNPSAARQHTSTSQTRRLVAQLHTRVSTRTPREHPPAAPARKPTRIPPHSDTL